MSEEQLKKEEKRLGSVAFAAQYQQRPVPREGALFKKDWLTREFMDLGDGYKVGDFYYPYSDCWHMVIVDPAGGESQAADFTAIGTFAVTPRNDMLVVDMVRDRIPLEEIQREVLKACQKRQLDVEFVGWEIGFFQTKMAKVAAQIPGMPPLKAIDPGGKSKFVRAIPAIVLAESGLLYLPEDTDWLEEFKKELLRFTGNNDPHDDQVDCLAMASQQRQLRENHSDAQPFSFGRPSQNYGRRY